MKTLFFPLVLYTMKDLCVKISSYKYKLLYQGITLTSRKSGNIFSLNLVYRPVYHNISYAIAIM